MIDHKAIALFVAAAIIAAALVLMSHMGKSAEPYTRYNLLYDLCLGQGSSSQTCDAQVRVLKYLEQPAE